MEKRYKIAIVAPFFNEGNAIIKFLDSLIVPVAQLKHDVHIVLVDDCSTDHSAEIAKKWNKPNIQVTYHLISLWYNMGHQMAIQQGCLYAYEIAADTVIVLDSDGEDDVTAIPELVNELEKGFDIVHVKRAKRNENWWFKMFYVLYKYIFKSITGSVIDFGNYSIFRRKALLAITNSAFNHFGAFCYRQRLNRSFITSDRQPRIDGKSKLGFTNLVFHGLYSFVEFADQLLIFFFRMFIFIFVVSILIGINLIYQKFFALTSVIGWFSTMSYLLAIFTFSAFGFLLIMLLLQNILTRLKRIRPFAQYDKILVVNEE